MRRAKIIHALVALQKERQTIDQAVASVDASVQSMLNLYRDGKNHPSQGYSMVYCQAVRDCIEALKRNNVIADYNLVDLTFE